MGRGRYLTLEEAARVVGKTTPWVVDAICQGKLDAKLEGGAFLVAADSLGKIAQDVDRTEPGTTGDAVSSRPSREGTDGGTPTGNTGTDGRKTINGPVSDKPVKSTGRSKPFGGIDGYYAGRREEGSSSPSAGAATSHPRLTILRAEKARYARKMRDMGTSAAARKAAEVRWAEVGREIRQLEQDFWGVPTQANWLTNPRPVSKGKPEPAKAKKRPSASSPRTPSSSRSSSAHSKCAARGAGADKRPSPPRNAARNSPNETPRDLSHISRLIKKQGHFAPRGDPTSGIVLVVEQPVGPRVLDPLGACLEAVNLPHAYVTYASTGLLKKELLAIKPHAVVAVGSGAAHDIDVAGYPLARRYFPEAKPGEWFFWMKGIQGLLLPSLLPALDDKATKHRFWQAFISLKDLAPTR